MRLPDTHVGSHLEKNESRLVELFMELDAIAIVNLVVFLLFLAVLALLFHLVLSLLKSKAKETAGVGTTYFRVQGRRKILPMAKWVKKSLFDFSKRKCWLFSLKQQIQRRTSLEETNRVRVLGQEQTDR